MKKAIKTTAYLLIVSIFKGKHPNKGNKANVNVMSDGTTKGNKKRRSRNTNYGGYRFDLNITTAQQAATPQPKAKTKKLKLPKQGKKET